ncbi:hypothetical protein [Vibrio tapetis]|uniref:Uncharacterized protein n=1 Tax=Vibrio tapetis subsp. tapetis TaxID=1671868 RepID=A0A2N8ZET0_9VIBR|nr:hypothetical protein [Vibrio tapetis]SON50409.1 protein of unknown function [Vibrio tapetis subsp. tapetis]
MANPTEIDLLQAEFKKMSLCEINKPLMHHFGQQVDWKEPCDYELALASQFPAFKTLELIEKRVENKLLSDALNSIELLSLKNIQHNASIVNQSIKRLSATDRDLMRLFSNKDIQNIMVALTNVHYQTAAHDIQVTCSRHALKNAARAKTNSNNGKKAASKQKPIHALIQHMYQYLISSPLTDNCKKEFIYTSINRHLNHLLTLELSSEHKALFSAYSAKNDTSKIEAPSTKTIQKCVANIKIDKTIGRPIKGKKSTGIIQMENHLKKDFQKR